MPRDLEMLREKLQLHMQKEGLRSTAQRRLVTDLFFQSTGHLTIEDMLALVRAHDAKVGYATVYRTLKLLKDSGLAYERHFGDGLSRYEVADEGEHHDHLICLECNKIVEFEDDEIEALQDALAQRHGYVLKRHKHELYGICADCQAQN